MAGMLNAACAFALIFCLVGDGICEAHALDATREEEGVGDVRSKCVSPKSSTCGYRTDRYV